MHVPACVGTCEHRPVNMYVCVPGDRAMAFSVVSVSWKGSGPVAPFQAGSHRAGSDGGKRVDSLSRGRRRAFGETCYCALGPGPVLEGMPSAGCAGLASDRNAHTQGTSLVPPTGHGSGSLRRPCSPRARVGLGKWARGTRRH